MLSLRLKRNGRHKQTEWHNTGKGGTASNKEVLTENRHYKHRNM